MPRTSLISIFILLVLLGAQVWRPRLLLRLSRYAFFISAFFVFFTAGYFTYQQYRVWEASPLSRLLLPPHQPIGYFAQYSVTNFWTGPLIALVAALICLTAAKILNKKFGGRFFEPAEPWLFANGLLLTGHPGWIYYAAAVLALALLIAVGRKTVSFYYLWLPAAIGVIIVNIWFSFPFSN